MARGRAPACAVLAAAFVVGPAAVPAAAAPPPGVCLTAPRRAEVLPARPWEDRQLDPARAWPVSRGAGVVVAVIDSGVDGDHPQLAGRVLPGFDFVRNVPGAQFDCAPHGTAVASIIAAAPAAGTAFHGVAPDVRLLPIRVTDRDSIDESSGAGGPRAETIGTAIRYAVDQGARVINMSLTVFRDVPEISNAVQYARFKDVLIVAAAGNQHDRGDPTPYPAAYDGVLGVGSVDVAGARAETSQVGDYVDLVAPGVRVTGADPGKGHELWEGTSFATPFVSGAAALVRAAHPDLSADQVSDRLTGTAGVTRGGRRGPAYGAGVVDPYRAVTDTSAVAPTTAAPRAVPAPRPDPALAREAAAQRSFDDSNHLVVLLLGGTLALLAAAGLFGTRRWTPARTPTPADDPARD